MTKNHDDITTIHHLHQSGQLDEAKKGYLAILKNNPDNTEALHALGILSAQQGNFTDAMDYLQSAIELDPNNMTLRLHQANTLKALGLSHEAIVLLHHIIDTNPDYSAALNNLGTAYFEQEKISQAIKYYRLAIEKQSDFVDAYYNLALALTKQANFAEAISTYKTLLTYAPEHAAGNFQLGCLLLEEDRPKEALTYFLLVAEQHPYHVETQTNLATSYLKQGALQPAKTHYLNALELTPKDTQILFNLGVIAMQQGQVDNAIQYYQRTLQINPDDFSAHNNIGVAFLAKNHVNFALHHFQEALRLQPNNEAVRYTVQMLSQDQRLQGSPPDYIKNLFDAYADHYEMHLLQSLDYNVPTLLLQAVNTVTKNKIIRWDILDLGCGTGLCGASFKPLANTLTGVDLSPNMLSIATEKNIYNELVASDLLLYLADKNSVVDLIIAGDVFVYTGDLHSIFAACQQALRPQGLFVFNTEITDKTDYSMNQSGRFSHQRQYLDQLAEKHGFNIAYYQQVITRQQNNTPVPGHLYVLQKVNLH